MTRLRSAMAGALIAGLAACQGREGRVAESPPDSLFLLGEELYQSLQFDSARTIWAIALERARASFDSVAEARLLTEIGRTHRLLGDLRAARGDQERAIELKNRLVLGDSALARSYNALGLVASDEGRHLEAVELFDQAATAAREAGDVRGVAVATGNMGLPLQDLGDLERARLSYEAMREAGRSLGDELLEANGLANEASIDVWQGDPEPAIARLDTARSIYRRIDYAVGEQFALAQLATAFELTGEYERAFASLDTALAIARNQDLLWEEADVLRLTAGLHAQVGDWRRAVRLYAQADSLFVVAGSESERSAVLRGAAIAYLALDNEARARTDAEEALRMDVLSLEPLEQLDDLVLLAEIDGRTDPDAATRRLDSASVVAAGLNTRGARLTVSLARARAADQRRDSPSVLEATRSAAADMITGDYWAEWETSALAARAHESLGALDSAAAAARRAVAAVERVRGALSSESLRTTFATERADVYGELVLVLLRQGRTDESFAVADAARSRGLLEHLAAARRGQGRPELVLGTDLLVQIERLVERLRATEPRGLPQRAAEVDPAAEEIARELAAVRGEYEALLTRAEERDPRAVALLGGASVRLDDLRAALTDDEILIEYLVTSDRLITFAVRRDGLRVIDQPIDGQTLAYQVGLLRDLWGRPTGDWRHGLPVSRALYQSLIAPVRDADLLNGSTKHIVIIPHGALGQLPFAALQDAESGRYLADDYAVTHLPSAASLPAIRDGVTPSAADAPNGHVFAPFPSELPYTAREADAFLATMPRSRSYRGPAATEDALRIALAGERLVHVATHGTLNARNPMFSRIEVARPRSGGSVGTDNDGRLEVHELIGLVIRSPLVFFSGCETGAAQAWTDDPVRGTADHTLAQAVLAAGARNVVSTLWRIDDAGAAELARRFYAHLARGSVSSALAAAQREMAADPSYANPYFWAGYTLSGEGRYGESQSEATTSVSVSIPQGAHASGPPLPRPPS